MMRFFVSSILAVVLFSMVVGCSEDTDDFGVGAMDTITTSGRYADSKSANAPRSVVQLFVQSVNAAPGLKALGTAANAAAATHRVELVEGDGALMDIPAAEAVGLQISIHRGVPILLRVNRGYSNPIPARSLKLTIDGADYLVAPSAVSLDGILSFTIDASTRVVTINTVNVAFTKNATYDVWWKTPISSVASTLDVSLGVTTTSSQPKFPLRQYRLDRFGNGEWYTLRVELPAPIATLGLVPRVANNVELAGWTLQRLGFISPSGNAFIESVPGGKLREFVATRINRIAGTLLFVADGDELKPDPSGEDIIPSLPPTFGVSVYDGDLQAQAKTTPGATPPVVNPPSEAGGATIKNEGGVWRLSGVTAANLIPQTPVSKVKQTRVFFKADPAAPEQYITMNFEVVDGKLLATSADFVPNGGVGNIVFELNGGGQAWLNRAGITIAGGLKLDSFPGVEGFSNK